jgi:PknH-like extracellular domain/TIR domain
MTSGRPATRNTAWAGPALTRMPQQLFVSYPRENKREVDELVDHLESMNYEVWADSALRGGQAWWDEILRRIAECDAFIAIVSRSALDSVACKRERDWARKLNKPVLPVAVEPVVEAALPAELSRLEIVDYSTPGVDAAFALAGALSALGPAPPPPEKWPDSPLAPLSYLSEVADRVSQDEPLTQDEQRRILDQLQTALGSADTDEQQGGRQILDRFSKRADLYAEVNMSITQLTTLGDKPAPVGTDTRSSRPVSGRGIFISYRRGNENFVAGRLYDNLKARFGPDTVFMDVDSIDLGVDFTKVLDQKLSQCSVVLVIIGRDWTSVAGADGRRRLENPGDFVRIEVEKALARDDVRVIPIYVDGASPPDESALPGPLAALARRNGIKISHEAFSSDFGRLVKILKRAGAGKARRSRTGWLITGGVGSTVVVATVIAVLLAPAGPPAGPPMGTGSSASATRPLDSILLSDADINTIMGASDMQTVEGQGALKPSSGQLAEVSPPECMGALYPTFEQTYHGSGVEDATWKVLEDPPGDLARAGDGNHHFVDQGVAAFPQNTDRALAFVQASANHWKACTEQTVTVKYTDNQKYTWTVGNLPGDAPTITQSFTQEGGHGYACQRVLSAVSNSVIDVKACGDHITDEATRIANKIAANVPHAPRF